MLAEDDPDMRSVLSDVLRDEGYEVIEAADGFEICGSSGSTAAWTAAVGSR